MNAPHPYRVDHDVKDTRRSLERKGRLDMWVLAVKDPNAFFDLMSDLMSAHPQAQGDILRELHINVTQSQWSRTRGIYTFDPALAQALDETPLDGLHDDVFASLPEWSVYIDIEREVDGEWLHGGFVAPVPRRAGLAIVVVSVLASPAGPMYHTLMLQTVSGFPVPFAQRYALAAQQLRMMPELARWVRAGRLQRWHELVLLRAAYLCTEQPDVRSSEEPRAAPERRKNVGPVRQWDVGVRFGTAFRAALADHDSHAGQGDRQRPRIHVRRGHWHTVLSGPMSQTRHRAVRWFPPTIVNANGDEMPVTLWRQKKVV